LDTIIVIITLHCITATLFLIFVHVANYSVLFNNNNNKKTYHKHADTVHRVQRTSETSHMRISMGVIALN